MYLKAERFAFDGVGVTNPAIPNAKVCPNECGLCQIHLSHTSLANVDLTNRCNLKCPICFANANQAGYVFEPTFEQVTDMLKTLRAERPVPCLRSSSPGGSPPSIRGSSMRSPRPRNWGSPRSRWPPTASGSLRTSSSSGRPPRPV